MIAQANDRIGVGFTWADPADSALDDQSTIDAFYRVQVTPEIAVSPTLQVILKQLAQDRDQATWKALMAPALAHLNREVSQLSPETHRDLQKQSRELAEIFQRSSSNVEGRKGYLSLRNHQLRGLDRPRKWACLTTIHNFFLTRLRLLCLLSIPLDSIWGHVPIFTSYF